jgi:hypothetical protein
MKKEKIDRRKFNGGNRTNGGRKKTVDNPVKVTVTFDASELSKLREVGNYNLLLRNLVRSHFKMDDLLSKEFDDLL